MWCLQKIPSWNSASCPISNLRLFKWIWKKQGSKFNFLSRVPLAPLPDLKISKKCGRNIGTYKSNYSLNLCNGDICCTTIRAGCQKECIVQGIVLSTGIYWYSHNKNPKYKVSVSISHECKKQRNIEPWKICVF